MRTLTAKEIAGKHSKNCAHKFVMLEDVKEWLKQIRISAHTDPARIQEVALIDELLNELEVK